MSRVRYIALRTLQTVFLLWFVLTFLFFFFRLMPGDFTNRMLYAGASPETIAAMQAKWGLNQPLHVQYYRYILNMATLDPGISRQFRVPVWEYVKMKIFNSFILIAPAITLSFIIGSTWGTIIGNRRDSRLEKYGHIPIIIMGTFPEFFTAMVLIIVFAGWLGWFPTSGLMDPSVATQFVDAPWWRRYLTWSFAEHYILPFAAVIMWSLLLPTLVMRTSIVEVRNQGFMYYHRLTGLRNRQILKHLGKHASLPVITLYPVMMTRAIGGLVLIEIVFNWPGIGDALVGAVLARDFPVMQFVFFLAAAWVIIANFVVDLVYGFVDPRVSVES